MSTWRTPAQAPLLLIHSVVPLGSAVTSAGVVCVPPGASGSASRWTEVGRATALFAVLLQPLIVVGSKPSRRGVPPGPAASMNQILPDAQAVPITSLSLPGTRYVQKCSVAGLN